MNVSKEMFVEQLIRNYGYTWSSANMLVDDFLACILDNMEAGRAVRFRGFGCFDIVSYAQRSYYCPITDEKHFAPEHYGPRFFPGKTMKRAVKSFEEHSAAAKECPPSNDVQSD